MAENVKKKKKTQLQAASKTFTSANTRAPVKIWKKIFHQKRGEVKLSLDKINTVKL